MRFKPIHLNCCSILQLENTERRKSRDSKKKIILHLDLFIFIAFNCARLFRFSGSVQFQLWHLIIQTSIIVIWLE